MILRNTLLLALLFIGGCASISLDPLPDGLTDQPPETWPQNKSQLQELDHWQLAGKLAVRQPSDSGTAIINDWTQNKNYYDIGLSSSFLGMGSTRLQGNENFMELTMPNGEQYHSGEPEALVEAATGWQLPLRNLGNWIKGLPGKQGRYRLLFDQQGHLVLINQQGWEIRFDRWRSFIEGYPDLPARLTAIKGEKRVRLVVSRWQTIGETSP